MAGGHDGGEDEEDDDDESAFVFDHVVWEDADDVEHGDDGLYHVTDPEAGTWLVEKLDEDPMDVVRFRWYPVASDEFPEEMLTTIEVSLSEEKGKIALHVEESGIAALSDDEDEAYQLWEDEAGLWDQAVDSAKDYLERR